MLFWRMCFNKIYFRIFPFLLPTVKDSKAFLCLLNYFFFFLVFQFHDAHTYEGRSEEGHWPKMEIGKIWSWDLWKKSSWAEESLKLSRWVNSQHICTQSVLGMFALVIKKCRVCLTSNQVQWFLPKCNKNITPVFGIPADQPSHQ